MSSLSNDPPTDTIDREQVMNIGSNVPGALATGTSRLSNRQLKFDLLTEYFILRCYSTSSVPGSLHRGLRRYWNDVLSLLNLNLSVSIYTIGKDNNSSMASFIVPVIQELELVHSNFLLYTLVW